MKPAGQPRGVGRAPAFCSLSLLLQCPPPARSPTLRRAVCLCLPIPESLVVTPQDTTNVGEDLLWSYHLCLAAGVCGPGASQPGQAAVRETWVSQVAGSVPSHTH